MSENNRNEYLKSYRLHRVHRLIIFSQEDYKFLQRKAYEAGKPFSTFVREMALAQSSNQYLSFDQQIAEIRLLLVRLGTNTNQIAHISNATFNIPHQGVADLQKQFKSIHNDIMEVFQKPILIEDVVRQAITKDKNYIQRIASILKEQAW